MTIKNKDGSTFTLKKPNPLMNGQILWKDKYILHNCEWGPVTIEDTQGPVTLPSQIPIKENKPDIVPVLEEIPTVPDDGRIEVWCLPAHIKEQVDKLYGQTMKRIKYGKKFMFEALLREEDDLHMVLWINTRAVTAGSVIFPRDQNKRWWRVNEVEEKDGGYNVLAVACEFTPEFSS